jgi:hypothetical protein
VVCHARKTQSLPTPKILQNEEELRFFYTLTQLSEFFFLTPIPMMMFEFVDESKLMRMEIES